MSDFITPFDEPGMSDAEMYKRVQASYGLTEKAIRQHLDKANSDGPEFLGQIMAMIAKAISLHFIGFVIANYRANKDITEADIREHFMNTVGDLYNDFLNDIPDKQDG